MSVYVPSTTEEFNKIAAVACEHNKKLVIDFMATWCGPCKTLAPLFIEMADKYKARAIFIKVDVDQLEDVAQRFQVSAMPTIIIVTPVLSDDGKSITLQSSHDHKHVGGSGIHVFLEGKL